MKISKNARLILITVCGVFLAQAVAHYDDLLPHFWTTYKAPDGSFSIELPSKPTASTTQTSVASADKTVDIYSVISDATKNTVYSCSYFDRQNTDQNSPQEILEHARDGSLQKIKGILINQKNLTVQGYPALELEANARGNSLVDERLILVNNRLFLIMAVTTVEQDREPKTIQRVFDSFHLRKRH